MENGQPTMSVSGWLPNGMKVYFTMPSNYENAMEVAIAFTDKLIAKGFVQHEPRLGAGEQKEIISHVSRRNKKNNDGSTSPVIDLYVNNERMEYRFLAVYLDTADDVQAFETACGLKLAAIPLNPTDAPPVRDNAALVVKLAWPVTIIFKDNPRYDANSIEKKPKRYFERWDGIASKSNEKGSNFNAADETLIIDADTWDENAVKQFVTHYLDRLDMAKLLSILKVSRFGEWQYGKKAAYIAVEESLTGVAS